SIFKLAVLGCIYATLVLIIFRIIGKIQPNSWYDRVSKRKFKFWFASGAIISLGLILFANTHWGSHGLGDSARIPLSYGKSINQINGTEAYLDIQYQYGSLSISDFAIYENWVVGKTEVSTVDDPPDFFAWNLQKDKIQYFNSEKEYTDFA